MSRKRSARVSDANPHDEWRWCTPVPPMRSRSAIALDLEGSRILGFAASSISTGFSEGGLTRRARRVRTYQLARAVAVGTS
jgi:hypothetical protein